jgi:hypothetical protein
VKHSLIALVASAGLLAFQGGAAGHVPYFEHRDFVEASPFRVRSIEQSVAVYAWLKRENNRTDDVDVYAFRLIRPARVYVQCLVPVRLAYKEFLPAFAVVGPGLPSPEKKLPFAIPVGSGAVVMENTKSGQHRSTFYEPFGGKRYYRGPTFDRVLEKPGLYRVYYWDPDSRGGDYVAVLGYRESWGMMDIVRALIYTPMIRWNLELHDSLENRK